MTTRLTLRTALRVRLEDMAATPLWDDAALNAGVLRYAPDAQAQAAFARDADLSGRIPVPVLTVHGIRDATAFVELQSAFRETMVAGGSGAQAGWQAAASHVSTKQQCGLFINLESSAATTATAAGAVNEGEAAGKEAAAAA